MFIVYDLIYLILAVIYLPVFLFKKKIHRGFQMRLGILPPDLGLDRPIWLHAVSVGEVMAIRGLLEKLRVIYPNRKFVISTVTPTGNKVARDMAEDNGFITYLPLDLSFIVRRVIDRINPSIFIIAETELWLNTIAYLHRKKIPVIVVNGRISDRSFGGYRRIKFLFKSLLNKIDLFCVQTDSDAQRLISLGVLEDKIRITGNMKFDNADYTDKYNALLKLGGEGKLWVAGSTHAGEEEIILSVYKKLLSAFSDLRLLIAPRHPERVGQVEKLIIQYNFQPIRVSQLHLTPNTDNLKPIFILDTIGQLLSFYALSDIVFVGGSLVKKGGHNILEPAGIGKPILFGPYMFNFRDIADLFLRAKAAMLVRNQQDLEAGIRYLLNNPARMVELSQQAKELILQNQGATNRNVNLIRECLKG
ncbi:MAG: 3-deoxy-D-manno-octulosonic acid transferase [Candidatus Omnitrophica bacterium]|nr:3-deoxy-D-manno-octulosonic acid transferase [Candidatus Omnitrophota bacterium]MCG2706842.1 3-deoxy-D-manno-octulosonic acid transferase [Candidatus Omnitrophota bacterium]